MSDLPRPTVWVSFHWRAPLLAAAFAGAWALLSVNMAWASPRTPEVLDGCEGEGCDCIAGFPQTTADNRRSENPVRTERGFKLHARMDSKSPILGHFAPGTLARPLHQYSQVLQAGAYVVSKLNKPTPGLKVGGRVTTLFRLGEGEIRVRHRGTWHEFEHDDIELRALRKTVMQPWTELAVGTLRGYAAGLPFKGCLE